MWFQFQCFNTVPYQSTTEKKRKKMNRKYYSRVYAIGHGFDVYYGFDPTVPIETAKLKKFIRSQ